MTDIVHINNQLPSDPSRHGSIEELIVRFISEKQVVAGSKDSYNSGLRQYVLWINSQNLQLADITKADLIRYDDYLMSREHDLSTLTVNGYLGAIRSFYEWLESYKLYPNVAKGLRAHKVKKDHRKMHLTEDEVVRLLEYMKTQSPRDYAIVAMMLGMGIREIEVVRMDMGDIVHKSGVRVALIQGKGRTEKDEDSVIIDEVWDILEPYLATREGASEHDPIFVSESNNSEGDRLTTRAVSRVCKEGMRAIGIDSKMYTGHSFRHTCAVLLLLRGALLEEVQQVLRHSSPETTMIYLESIRAEKRLKDATVGRLKGLFGNKNAT